MAPAQIPSDIATEILSRLPLKSLVRFKCVSKPWLYMISESRFRYWLLRRHLDCDPLSYCPYNQSSIFIYYREPLPGEKVLEHKLLQIDGDSFNSARKVDFPLLKGNYFEIKGACCHGMFCIAIDLNADPEQFSLVLQNNASLESKIIVLWNPTIGEHRILPLPLERGFCDGVCGLGFDLASDDFKVVSFWGENVYIFSVKMNTWQVVGKLELEHRYSVNDRGVPANGYLYWDASESPGSKNKLLCMNLSNNTFEEVSTPFDPREIVNLQLQSWGSGISVYLQKDRSIWFMKENSWTRMMKLPPPFGDFYALRPRCISKNGRLLVSSKNMKLVLYDGDGDTYETVKVEGLPPNRKFGVYVYSGSLISPYHTLHL